MRIHTLLRLNALQHTPPLLPPILLQGTNAHVIVLAASTSSDIHQRANAPPPKMIWACSRLWPVPRPSWLLSSVIPDAYIFDACLAVPQLAYLWEHVVAGVPLFPGTGLLEICCAALTPLLPDRAFPVPYTPLTLPTK